MSLLEIKNLHVAVNGKPILKNLNLSINAGEVHAVMGPNGSGKSTLSHVLAGQEGYEITSGQILYQNEDLLQMPAHIRAQNGVFLAFQYPVEIPGVNNAYFLRAAYNNLRAAQGQSQMDAAEFMQYVRQKLQLLGMDKKFLQRGLNEGFSGGEKKRNEILQMLTLEPKLSVLDETDSGLDIDALQMVAKGVNHLRAEHRSFLLITHYQRLLDYIVPDYVHVLADGQIVKSGDKSLAYELEAKGYGWLAEAADE